MNKVNRRQLRDKKKSRRNKKREGVKQRERGHGRCSGTN